MHLDLTHLGEELLQQRLPQVKDLAARYAGVDAARNPIPIEPAQHYSMGGIRTDVWGMTSIPGLLAAGEAANVSVHGANRLGGNSLLETVVFGRRSGQRAAEIAGTERWVSLSEAAVSRYMEPWNSLLAGRTQAKQDDSPFAIQQEATSLMTRQVGVFRDGPELEDAVKRLAELKERYRRLTPRLGSSPIITL